ncbi:unnamed protein product [Moneuplotes crassus]|uniref:Uncharacterized protein n=1 Tax=Euplotes crassus TaxID=5936 RepID=A0AAD1X824_EUPCR|nr:unnamed protein product [Moneuplotes crassus]
MPFVCTCTEYQNKCHHAEPEVRTTPNLGEQETFRETESQVKCSFCQSKSSSGQDLPNKIHSRNEASRILQFESEIIQRCEPEFATVTAKQLHSSNEEFQASCRTNEAKGQTKRASSNTLQHQSTDRASREQLELGADITLPRSEFNECMGCLTFSQTRYQKFNPKEPSHSLAQTQSFRKQNCRIRHPTCFELDGWILCSVCTNCPFWGSKQHTYVFCRVEVFHKPSRVVPKWYFLDDCCRWKTLNTDCDGHLGGDFSHPTTQVTSEVGEDIQE